MNLAEINNQLKKTTPLEIVKWADSLNKKIILTTNFGPYESVILHLVYQVNSDIEVLWIDSGYNTRATYKFAEKIIQSFKLRIQIYTPLISAKRRDTLMQGIPEVDSPLHKEFTRQVKLEPFNRAMRDLKPELWLTAIRREQTSFRKSLDIVTIDENLIKVAPLFYTSKKQLEDYLLEYDLPNEQDYYDPTKVLSGRECGLHKRNIKD